LLNCDACGGGDAFHGGGGFRYDACGDGGGDDGFRYDDCGGGDDDGDAYASYALLPSCASYALLPSYVQGVASS